MHYASMGLRIEAYPRNGRTKGTEENEIVAERHTGSTAGMVAHSPAKAAVYGAVHLVFPHLHIIDQRSDIAEHSRITPLLYPVIYNIV